MKRGVVALALALAGACDSSAREAEPAAEPATAGPEAAAPGRVEVAESVSVGSTARPSGELPTRPAATELTFTLPEGWIAETPTVALRKVQARVPRAAGDDHDAELTVLWRGAVGMGPLDAQLTRWAQQLTQPDGGSSRERLLLSTRKVGTRTVTEAELAGTCVAEKQPGSPERWNEPDWKLLGAVIESEFGPYYLRLIGPRATVDAAAAGFRALIESTAR
jgi:hypothetical protein